MIILATIFAYIAVLLLYSHFMGGRGGNDAFFRANNSSPWYLVAIGMIGASISGVTFVSVPGMVNSIGMTYMQTCLGFIFGYAIVAFVLLPIYYRLRLTTIYTYLDQRLGGGAYKTGAWFFLLSKMTGAAVRFYVVCMILQRYVLESYGIPFPVTVVLLIMLIWLYTRRSGIKSLVWTDTLQTLCMFLVLCLIIYKVMGALGMTPAEAVRAIAADERSQWFVFNDHVSRQYFWKQFLSGIFIVIVMTGLDQDMMQKNLTCKSLRDAQKDMCTYGIMFVPANLLFLALGILLSMLCVKEGLPVPKGDELLPFFAASGRLGEAVVVLFTIGIVAASFSSADSALTSMTTSYCIDISGKPHDERHRKCVHIVMAAIFAMIIFVVEAIGSNSVIDAIYTICSYTYGPLLGLFAYAYFCAGRYGTKKAANRLSGKAVGSIAILSPAMCYLLDFATSHLCGYHFGYELLMINGGATFMMLHIINNVKRKM